MWGWWLHPVKQHICHASISVFVLERLYFSQKFECLPPSLTVLPHTLSLIRPPHHHCHVWTWVFRQQLVITWMFVIVPLIVETKCSSLSLQNLSLRNYTRLIQWSSYHILVTHILIITFCPCLGLLSNLFPSAGQVTSSFPCSLWHQPMLSFLSVHACLFS